MQLKNIIFLVLIAASVGFFSCNSNNSKELIVNKWRITDIDIPTMPLGDAEKAAALKGTMEFTKDGKWHIKGMGNDMSGSYTLSDDGKNIYIISEDKTETHEIVELTKSKMVLLDKANNTKLTVVPK
jgi:hypothetical protein